MALRSEQSGPKIERRLPKISANGRLRNGRFFQLLCILQVTSSFSTPLSGKRTFLDRGVLMTARESSSSISLH